ncbi:uncharacterized protein N7443_009031 [Penicillium atrosanguineum]|uniref:Protoporphyrinogen oxidase n=1 Tax=Penicillium atrosanguineum TaxID=1132637 RepID=A0A9W9PNS0_9EURO|nr:uncharacterized protein N7443_009031 [Penicillium atrosanguineum]KAJ5125991.1 hypothetical protein N7526_008168 [Penicillium atrosanguineum]KAJ5293078.1 hypothetical protein N7443_009031 [Penicillium atrosanguineum]KAJ5302886.1 hypothetical protein N7476_009685 [Penicillium atrosanguineum]
MRLTGAAREIRPGHKALVSILRSQRRAYNLAVVGGGITGLTSAWLASHNPKCTSVTLLEKEPRVGGWLQSEKVPVDGGHVLFEYGPRTLRSSFPGSMPLLTMMWDLGMFDQIITTSRKSPAARNRFIYYPDRLVKIPTLDLSSPSASINSIINTFQTLRSEPVFENVMSSFLFEPTKPPRPHSEWQKDESIASFIGRRFHPKMAENLVSAVMHGIYAGDIDQLSAQTILGSLRNMDADGILKGMLDCAIEKKTPLQMDDMIAWHAVRGRSDEDSEMLVSHMRNVVKESSTFILKGGTQQLVEGLETALNKSDKVKILTGTNIKSMTQQAGRDSIQIQTAEYTSSFDHVIAALPAPALGKILESKEKFPNQKAPPHDTIHKLRSHNYATTIMVINLYYSNPNLLPIEGFGYLIPRSIPAEQNPECGLGVIFASASSSGTNAFYRDREESQDTAPGTKLTIMMGGHYWDGWKDSDYPDHDSAVKMARAMLERHLGITDAPTVARTRLQKDAVPQYTVGHLDRMYSLSKSVRNDFNRRLVLAGNWYTGVSVGDCVRSGMLATLLGTGHWRLGDRPVEDRAWEPWRDYNYKDWEFEGGIPTAPIRIFDFHAGDSKR